MVEQLTSRASAAPRIESLLASRLFVAPLLVGNRLYFESNLSGAFGLYVMDLHGSVPVPLLPPNIALQNPELIGGEPYHVFPDLDTILVMIDRDGDENYQPMRIPLTGGIPEPAFPALANHRCHLVHSDTDTGIVFINAESRQEAVIEAYRGNLATGELEQIAASKWGAWVDAVNASNTMATVEDGYTAGDIVVSLWHEGADNLTLLHGTPLDQRTPDGTYPPSGINSGQFVEGDTALLFLTTLFEDTLGLGRFALEHPDVVSPVQISGTVHEGVGETEGFRHLHDDRYALQYNIDGATWLYEGTYAPSGPAFHCDRVLVGQGELANGTMEAYQYDRHTDTFALSFSTATSPTQLYVIGPNRYPHAVTSERVLGIPDSLLSAGEDASFTSHDGLRISARLYLPARDLDYQAPYPLVYYIHGGPQSQERPNFAWFSMPLIQFLTLQGFAVFVPNVRGSTGYGFDYMKRVDRDWGGQDRLDHVHAMKVLGQDDRIDTNRAGVIGRSYGGYMTLTLASRHPDLWKAAVDMFGPYDLSSFMDRIPETWKPYFRVAVGDPETDREFLLERSPRTYIDDVTAPMLVIQGANDPRVVEQESRDVVDRLRAQGKDVDILVFEDEGHDVLKFENRVRCYNAITDFFVEHLHPEFR